MTIKIALYIIPKSGAGRRIFEIGGTAVKKISSAVIKRLPRYYRYLDELINENVERISSQELSRLMNVTASQIRQDLNNFGGFGQQGYGYNVANLHEEIGKILGLDREYKIVVVGAGNLGRAIANYGNFERRGFNITAVFDRDPELIGKHLNRCDILDVKDLVDYIKAENVDIVALTLPKEQATLIARELCDCGIKAIWNFAHTDLDLPSDVIVENVHLSESIMRITYKLSENDNRNRD